jgi:tetratricopeptide (TPR) repeat protein
VTKTIKQASKTKIPVAKPFEWQSLIWVLPVLLALLAMGGGVYNDFVEWDDNKYVYDNEDLGKWNLAGWKYLLTQYVMGNWHPLTMITLSLEFTFFGKDPMVYHATNIVLHALITLWVFLVAQQLWKQPQISLIAAALFAVHPLHVESVAWISERKDVLYTCFTMAALWNWNRYRSESQSKYAAYAFICFFLACTAKAQAVVMPVLAVLLDVYARKYNFKSLKPWLPLIPFFILALIIGIVAIDAQAEGGNVRVFREYSVVDQVLIGIQGFVLYLVKTIIPYGQSAYYPYPEKAGSLLPIMYYVGPVILAVLVILILRFRKQLPALWMGMAFFTLAILPVLQFLPVGETMLSERYYYLPSVGLFLFMGYGLYHLAQKHMGLYALPAIMILAWLILCMQRVQIWNNTYRLFLDVMHKYENVPVAYNNIANQFTKDKQYDRAIPMYKKALQIRKNYAIGWHNLGNNYTHTARYPLALQAFQAYMEIRPDDGVVFAKIGTVYSKMGSEAASAGRIGEAEQYFTLALEHDADLTECYVNLGNINAMNSRFEAAEKYYQTALQLNPENNGTWFNLGLMRIQAGNTVGGTEAIQKAAQMGNGNAQQWLQQFAPDRVQ